jgi:hypothetical protein
MACAARRGITLKRLPVLQLRARPSIESFMRILKYCTTFATALLLAGCVSSLLVGSQLQSRLMWAFITPLVGFNPNEINFFEAPIIKDRMTALLGEKYEPTMRLLRTANQIQKEGALYYVVSRYAPAEAQQAVDAAGLVWNADTNQMAVMLVQDGVPDLLAEQAQTAATGFIQPLLPTPLKTVYDQAVAAKAAVDAQQQRLETLSETLGGDLGEAAGARLQQSVEQRVEDTLEQTVEQQLEDVEDAVESEVEEQADELLESEDPLLDLIRQRNL